MGTLKLNKQTVSTDAAKAETVELCELAKQDEGFVEEFKNLRTANETVYRRNDRACSKIITAAPTRYTDANGEFKEISNRLVDNGTEIVNEANSFKVMFNKNEHSGKIFDLQRGKRSVSLSAVGTGKARSHACGCKCAMCSGKDNAVTATLDNGTEIEYVTLNDRIKENIIVKERQDSYEYNFTLNIGDLTVEEGEHNELLLKDAETGEIEFTIPAPYMYDANGVRSGKVNYDIDVNGEELLIKVIADAEFINAQDRSLPVIIDPQIVVKYGEVLDYYSESYSSGADNDYEGARVLIAGQLNSLYDTWCYVRISKNKIPLDGVIEKVVFRITAKPGSYGYLRANDKIYAISEKTIDIDITDLYLNNQNYVDFTIFSYEKANFNSATSASFYNDGVNAPKVIITYYENADEYDDTHMPSVKQIGLNEKANVYLDMKNSDTVTAVDDITVGMKLPINISHIHKVGKYSEGVGTNWQFNLCNRMLIPSIDDTEKTTRFRYRDEFGNYYMLQEKYYWVDGNETKIFIDKNQAILDINGNLMYEGQKVYVKQYCGDYTLIAKIDDYINSDLIEQRQSELIQLEETVKSYERAFVNLVIVESAEGNNHGSIISNLGGFEKGDFDLFIKQAVNKSTYLVMSESEVPQFKISFKNYSDKKKEYDSDKTSEKWEQYQISKAQLEAYIKQCGQNLEYLKDNFVTYLQKKRELEAYKIQMPENYLRDKNGIVSGFNYEGKLVCIFDNYGNASFIEYDFDGLITGIYEGDTKVAELTYSNRLLRTITDNRGRQITYNYDSDKQLTKVTYPDGKTVALTYKTDNRIETLTENSDTQSNFTYDSGKLKKLTTKSVSANAVISDLTITHDTNPRKVEFTDGYDATETFTFNSDNKLTNYSSLDSAHSGKTQTYTYANNGRKITCVTTDNVSSRSVTEIKEYDDLNILYTATTDWQNISDATRVKTVTTYSYDYSNNLTQKITTKSTDTNGTVKNIKTVTNYSYNANGKLVLTESYVEGEEKTSGINFEERVYNDDGNMVKCIRWNSLDSSSKFYEEAELEKDGRVKYDKDETGAYSAMYEYVDGTTTVNSVTYPDGSKIAYGRNPYNGEVTSVTRSTADGEANTNNIVYENGLPVKVTSGNTTLEYKYDYKGRKTEVAVNGANQVSYTYIDGGTYDGRKNFGTVVKTYATDEEITESRTGVLSSSKYKITETVKVDGDDKYKKEYDEKGRLTTETDSVSGTKSYTYDSYDNVTKITGGGLTESYTYNALGELTQKALTDGVTQTYTYAYKDNAARSLDYILFKYTTNEDTYKFKPLTDVNGRNTGKEIYNGESKVAAEYITYRKVGDHATNMPATVWFGSGSQIKDNIKYKYDSCGNICEITQNGHLVAKYTYDSLNRLVREDNKAIGKTTLFTYDNAGNITERCEYAYTSKSGEELEELNCTHYSYDYKGDELVKYNDVEITYNSLGNPNNYRGNDCLWEYGTRLKEYGAIEFTYDGFGRRISKKKNGITVSFTYDSEGRLIKQSDKLEFIYDNSGVVGVIYDEEQYFYRKDAQGNIIAILNSNGTVEATYEYDAWGNHKVNCLTATSTALAIVHIGNLNPFRYRGYYYDTETKLYYLQTRYYDPEVGRFISQDSIEYADPETVNGLNLYAYCGNNPVMSVDPIGCSWSSFWSGVGNWFKKNYVKLAIGAAFIIAGAVVTFFTAGMGTAGLIAAGGALLASAKAVGISMIVSAGIGAVVGGITGGWEGALNGFADGLADGFMWGGIFSGGAQIISGGFKIAARFGAATGRNGGIQLTQNLKILSPNNVKFYENGGTLLKIGKNFRIDVGSSTLLHMHAFGVNHIPLGTILSTLFGSYNSLW